MNMLKNLNNLVNKITGKDKLDVAYYKEHRITTTEVSHLYNLSKQTLKNYRRGYYYRGSDKIVYYQAGNGKIMNLRHIPQVDGDPIWYMVSWVNEWLRLIGQEEFIPKDLQSL